MTKLTRRLTVFFMLVLISLPAQSQSGDVERVVGDFLSAWSAQDYDRMYALVHPTAQTTYPQQVFINRYTGAADALSLVGLSYEITNVTVQGTSAAVTHTITFESGAFEPITDENRTMRLVRSGSDWRVAWSTLDIFDMMAGNATIRVDALPQTRATIYDRNGQPVAWDGGTTVSIFGIQQNMNGIAECRALLADVFMEQPNVIQRRFANLGTGTRFWLGETNTERYNQFRTQLIETCGIDEAVETFVGAPHRTYYGGRAMAHVAGYIGGIPADQIEVYRRQGYSEGELVGLAGAEFTFQNELAGQPERVLRIVDGSGIILRELATTAGSPPTPVQLTIDRDLQLITAEALADAFRYGNTNWGSVSSGGAAVVLDINTGEILALASYPIFDPYLFNPSVTTINDRQTWLAATFDTSLREPIRNRAVSEQEAPGSVFKVITAAAVLNEGITQPDEIFYCGLQWEGAALGDSLPFRQDWRAVEEEERFSQPAGDVTPSQALTTSCNPFFWEQGAKLYRDVSPSAIGDYAERMGAVQIYDMDGMFAPGGTWGQAQGAVPAAASVDTALSEAIGQGSVTMPPLQMGVVTMGIGNGGTVYEPHIVKQVGGFDGTEVTFNRGPEVMNMLDFNPGVLEAVQEGMCGVTTDPVLGTAFGRFNDDFGWVENDTPYTSCGKTGTAQTAQFPNAWYVSYAPRENPEIAIVVMVEQALEGSQVSAPITRRILDQYFGVPVERYPEWWNTEPYSPLPVPQGVR